MRVWITRSQPGASRQAAVIRREGYEVVVAPVLEIAGTDAPVPSGGYDVVVFLSEQAVMHSAQLDFCAGARVLAVGGATAKALAVRGVAADVPEPSSSEGLLDLLASADPAFRRVLIVAGVEGRKTLRDVLLGQGVEVDEYLNYRRVPLRIDMPNHAQMLEGVDAVLVGSQDGFRQVARLWFDSNRDAAVRIIAASERVAELGGELGFNNVEVARSAATEDWLTALGDTPGRSR